MMEFHFIQSDGYEAATGILDTCRYIGEFIDPLEQVAAKQRPLIVHVFRLYEFSVVHFLRGTDPGLWDAQCYNVRSMFWVVFWGLTLSGYNACMLFDPTTADIFLDVFDGAPVRNLNAGETLFHAGTAADQVFNIVSGTLMATRIGNDGRRQVLSFLFPDNFVGLSSTEHYFFTVEAVTDAQVVCRPRVLLEERLRKDPQAEQAFLNMVFRVLENSLDLVYSLGQRIAVERLAVFLLYLRNRQRIARDLPEDAPELMTIDLPMSRQDIADFLGLKKETVSRSFTQLDKQGLIERPDNFHATICDLAGLRKLAGIQDFASPLRLTAAR